MAGTTGTTGPGSMQLDVQSYYDLQKVRIEMGNRRADLVRRELMTEKEAEIHYAIPSLLLGETEKYFMRSFKPYNKEMPIYAQWMQHVKGIGPVLAAGIISVIESENSEGVAGIKKFDNPAKLWAYCGLHVDPETGLAVRRKKGVKSNWSSFMKTLIWKVGESFVKCGGPYREEYDKYRARIIERETNKGNIVWKKNMTSGKWSAVHHPEAMKKPPKFEGDGVPEWTVGRIHAMAKRYASKLFLAHMWEVWRTLEGLSIRTPYSHEYQGHSMKKDPWDYIVKKKGKKDEDEDDVMEDAA